MTQEQFILWLEGFLDGNDLSVNPALTQIKEKFDSIKSFSTYPPTYSIIPCYTPDWHTTTTAKTDSTPTSGKQLLNENEG